MRVTYIVRVIEYQERGLPHAHIVFRLDEFHDEVANIFENMMNIYNDKINSNQQPQPQKPIEAEAICELIDEYISAEIPDEQEEPILHDIITQLMIHSCRSEGANPCLNKNGLCKNGFNKTFVKDKTTFNASGFPEYRRRSDADLMVVAYNREIVLDWEGHAHLTYSGQTFSVLYLYKYLYKGNKKMEVGFRPELEAQQQVYQQQQQQQQSPSSSSSD